MALLFMDGFDAGDTPAKWTVASGSWSYSSSTRFSSGGAASVASIGLTAKPFTASAQVFVGCAISVGNLNGRVLFTLRGDTGTIAHLRLIVGTDGSIDLQRGTTTIASTPIGTLSLNIWKYVELSATIADAGGTCVVKVDGTTLINFTGDTKNAGTSTNLDTMIIGESANIAYDDLYICNNIGSAPYNTFLGDIRINTIIPNGAGSSTSFTPSAGANYSAVDELPYSAADYVTATTSGNRDLYSMSDITGNYTVLGVQNNVIAKKVDAGGTALKPALKSGASVYYGSSAVLTANDQTISDLRITDPSTSLAWTTSGVNALEAGMEIA